MRSLLLLLQGVPIPIIISIALLTHFLTEKKPRLLETRPSWYLFAQSHNAAAVLLSQLTAA
jgi:hypothetical protein